MSTEGLLSGVLSGLGTGLKAGGQVAGGFAARNVAEFNTAALEQEAAASRAMEPIARGEAAIESRRIRERGMAVTGEQRAAYAAAGVDVSGGTPMLVMLESIRQASQDAFLARYRGDVRAYGLEVEAVRARNQATITRVMGRQSVLGGLLGAGGTLLGGLKFSKTSGSIFPTIPSDVVGF